MFDGVLGTPRDWDGSDLSTDLQHLPHSARTVVDRGRGVGRRADDEVAELPRPIAAPSELDGVGVGGDKGIDDDGRRRAGKGWRRRRWRRRGDVLGADAATELDVGHDSPEQREGALVKVDVVGRSDAPNLGDVDEVAAPAHVVAEMDGLDPSGSELVRPLLGFDDAGAVAEHDSEPLQVKDTNSSGRLLHRDDPVRRLGGAAVGVQPVVDEAELQEEKRPELRLFDAPTGMGDGGARAAQKKPPSALGDGIAFVDVGGRKGALDCEDGAKLLDAGRGELRPVVAVPLVDNARDPGLDEQMRVVAHEGARGVDDLLGVDGVSQEVDGDDSRVVVDEVDRKGEAMRRGRKRPAQIRRDALTKVSVDASVGGVIRVPLAPPVEKARGAIPKVAAARDAVPTMAQSVDDAARIEVAKPLMP